MADPTYPLYPTFAFLGFILSLIPLPWHLQAWNSGTCYFMLWSALACLNQFVNSVVWHGNALNPAPAWCEVSIRILMGASVGIPASSLCINRRLYHIASVQTVSVSHAEKRREILIDTFICVLFPMIYIALQYVVQGHRFNVLEDIGCQPALYNTHLTYFISYTSPILLGMISAVYCVLSLRSFIRRRVQFNQFLASNKSLTAGRYFRLMALATTELLLTIPLAIFVIWINTVSSPIGPWISWEDTHFHFSRIEQIPAVLWKHNPRFVLGIELTRWSTPACAFVFFAFFGFAAEAKRNYARAFWWCVKPFGFYPPQAAVKAPVGFASVGHFAKPKPPTFSSTFNTSSTTSSTTQSSDTLSPPTLKHYASASSSFFPTKRASDAISSQVTTPSSQFSFALEAEGVDKSRHASFGNDSDERSSLSTSSKYEYPIAVAV
ncbi:hypothetical protein ONZ45_g7353 [Pleurotus djamor]|nr:hypothetical protein ONZ45_g7353 [Pleurotus djamor]